MRITLALSSIMWAAALLSACSTAQSEPTPTPAPTVIAQPAPEPPAPPPAPKAPEGKWTDWPLAAGKWIYRTDARGSLALFGPVNSDALFMVRCDQARRQLFLSRAGVVANSGTQMTLRASSGLQSYSVRNSGSAQPYAAISVPTTDIMMDRIIYSRGRFAVETTGLQSIALPAWPEFNRVVEDCRS